MKKLYLIVQKKDVSLTLKNLQEMGILHVEHQKDIKGTSISELKDEVLSFEKVINVLEQNLDDSKTISPKASVNCQEKVCELLEYLSKLQELDEKIKERQVVINNLEPWGNFNPKDIRELDTKGINIFFAELSQDDLKKIPENTILEKISTSKGITKCLLISKEDIDLPFNVLILPEYSLNEMLELQDKDRKEIEEIDKKIKYATAWLDSLKNYLKQIQNRLKFEEVSAGLAEHEEISLLKGFCPIDSCKLIEDKAKEEKWGILMEDPSDEDQVPTLLRNPKWVDTIKPILSLANILPGYRELDISPLLLIFLSLFVGMLIGDAGYGVLIALIFGIFHFTLRKKIKEHTFFHLAYLLCFCTILWGIFTGTFFGQKWVSSTIKPAVPWLLDTTNIQMLCFLIGAIHLSIARLWRAVILWPSKTFLSELGWLSIVWGMFFAAKMLVLGLDFPDFAKIFFIIGPILILVFTKPSKNLIKTVAADAFPVALSIIGTFTDVVSYIRLYAVGLATVAIADAANGMGLAGMLILHMINILLAALAILVHGLRLNILEFSSHLSLEWKGFSYNPFRKLKES